MKRSTSSINEPEARADLAALYFTMNHAETAVGLEVVDMADLDPFLRNLLFTDGTVTRALEVQTLTRVGVEVLDQSPMGLPAEPAHYLMADQGDDCLRRRITMHSDNAALGVWAESHILPDRLPPGFMNVLDGTAQGIGESLEGVKLESRRELLWFRVGSPPQWAPGPLSAPMALIRLYRIITCNRPAFLIAEAFAVERDSGRFRLLGGADGSASN